MNASERPTWVRYEVVLVTTLMSLLLYLDRFCISFAEGFIREDLGISNQQVGWMLGAFFWTYALGQVPAGWLTDRFGARRMLTAYILIWSLFTALTGLASGFVMLLMFRFGIGIGQAGAYPTSASLLSKWVPVSVRGTASGIVSTGGRVGGALAPLLTGYLIVMLVPASVPSQLEPGDLLDAPRLCFLIVHGDDTQSSAALQGDTNSAERGQKILSELSSPTRLLVESTAAAYVPPEERKRESGEKSLAPTLSADDVASLRAGLNEILHDRAFYQYDLFADIEPTLEKEAKTLLPQRESLSEEKLARLNRLLLEAAYPNVIKRVYGKGWRQVMGIFGAVGAVVALIFWLTFRNVPAAHPRVNAAELELIEHGRVLSPAASKAVGRAPVAGLVSSMSMWCNCLMQFTTNIGWIFLVTLLPGYLDRVHHVPVEKRAWMSSIPILAGMVGMFWGGPLADWFTRLVGLRWGRALPIGLSRLAAMAAYGIVLFEPSPWVAVAAFSLVSFLCDLGIPAIWAYAQDVGGRYVGSVLGWGNMFGNFGAAVGPPLLAWIVGNNLQDQHWTAMFLTASAAFLISGLAGLGINATIPIKTEDDE